MPEETHQSHPRRKMVGTELQAVKSVKNLIVDLRKSDLTAQQIHNKTRTIRRIVNNFENVFEPRRKALDALLTAKEKEAMKKYQRELKGEIPEAAKGHLTKLAETMEEGEANHNNVIGLSKSLMVAVNKENLKNMGKGEAVATEELDNSKKVLEYLKLVHDVMEITDREHLSNFERLLSSAESTGKK